MAVGVVRDGRPKLCDTEVKLCSGGPGINSALFVKRVRSYRTLTQCPAMWDSLVKS